MTGHIHSLLIAQPLTRVGVSSACFSLDRLGVLAESNPSQSLTGNFFLSLQVRDFAFFNNIVPGR